MEAGQYQEDSPACGGDGAVKDSLVRARPRKVRVLQGGPKGALVPRRWARPTGAWSRQAMNPAGSLRDISHQATAALFVVAARQTAASPQGS